MYALWKEHYHLFVRPSSLSGVFQVWSAVPTAEAGVFVKLLWLLVTAVMWQWLSDSLGWIRPVSYERVWQLRHPCCPVSPPSRWPVTLLAAARPWLIPDQQREEKSTGVRFAPAGSAALPSSQNKSDRRGVSLCWEFIYEEAVIILNDLQKERKNQNKMCLVVVNWPKSKKAATLNSV